MAAQVLPHRKEGQCGRALPFTFYFRFSPNLLVRHALPQPQITEVLPKSGLVFYEKGVLTEVMMSQPTCPVAPAVQQQKTAPGALSQHVTLTYRQLTLRMLSS